MGSEGQVLQEGGETVGPGVGLGREKRRGSRYIEVQDRALDVKGSPGKRGGTPGVKMGHEWGKVGGERGATGY